MYFRLMAAMFDLLVTPTSESMLTSPTVLLDSENVEVAVGLLISYIQAGIYDNAYTSYWQPSLICKSESIHIRHVMSRHVADPENVGLTTEIPLPATIQGLQSELLVFPVSHPPL